VRTLPLLVAPIDDETLLSFCRRLAAHNGGCLANVLKACGLGGAGTKLRCAPHMAIVLEPDVLADLAEATGITTERAERLLLASYRGALDAASCPRDGGLDLLRWTRRQGLMGVGSRVCPVCVGDDGAFRMAWRFAWSFACPEHGTLLDARCPGCHRPYSYDGNHRPALSSLVPVLSACANQPPRGEGNTGRNCRPCGHPFPEVPVRPATARVSAAQRRLRGVLQGEPATVHGEAVSAKEWRSELTSLVAILAQLAEVDDLGEISQVLSAAFGSYVAAGRGSGPRSVWPCPDPALLAAVVPTAVELLDCPSSAAFDAALAPFVRRGFETRFRFLSEAHTHLGVRGRTMQAWGRILGPRVHLTTRLRARYVGPAARPDGLAPLPQLLWPEVFDQRFARFLPDVRTGLRRRFCSLALGVLATKGSYLDVAAGLGLPRNDSLAHHLSLLLRDRHEDGSFYDGLVEAGQWLAAQDSTVDYGARRRSLGDLTLIPPEDWAWACWASGLYVDRGLKRRHSSTWIWCTLTGGEPSLAPTFRGTYPGSEKAMYGRFQREHLPALEPALVALATRELQRRGLSGRVRADLSGWGPPPPPVPDDITALGVFRGRTRRPVRRHPPATSGGERVPFVDDLVEVFGLDLLASLVGVTRRMLYRYQDGERRPAQTIQLRLAHLTDIVATLRVGRNDHAILRWFTEARDDGPQPLGILSGRWRPLDEGPRRLMAMAASETPGPRPTTALRTTGRRRPTLSLVHDIIDTFGLEDLADRTGIDRLRLMRYRRGDTWPSWDTQRQFRALLAEHDVANLPEPMPIP